MAQEMFKYSFVKYLLYDLKHFTRYPPSVKYENDQQVKKTKEEYSPELERLKEAHPRVNAEDIDRGFHTHTLMTGGKFLFNNEPIPTEVEFPGAFAELHRSLKDAAPRLLGRKIAVNPISFRLFNTTTKQLSTDSVYYEEGVIPWTRLLSKAQNPANLGIVSRSSQQMKQLLSKLDERRLYT